MGQVIDYLLDGLFWIDILVSMRTSYYTRENELILDTSRIVKRYKKFWLPVDLMGAS